MATFAGLTGDMHPQHTDAEWSAQSRFGERIAHGLLVLSCGAGLMPFDPERIVALRRVGDAVFKRRCGSATRSTWRARSRGSGRSMTGTGSSGAAGGCSTSTASWSCAPRVELVRGGAPPSGSRCCDLGLMLLEGKRLLVTGVLTRELIAYAVAERAQQEGAEIVLTGFGRSAPHDRARGGEAADAAGRARARREQARRTWPRSRRRWGGIDGALHAIAFAPGDALGGNFMRAPPESAEQAFRTSAYSFKALAEAWSR